MSIFKRLKDITLANINSMIDGAEDPVKMVDQYIRNMADDIQDAEGAVATQIAVENRLKAKFDEAAAKVTEYAAGAQKAVDKKDDDLARQALEAKKTWTSTRDDFEKQYGEAKTRADELRGQMKEMRSEFTKMKNKRDTLVARSEAAKAQKAVNDTMSSFNSDGARSGFERMEEKVGKQEAQAQASGELRESNTSLDKKLAELGNDQDIENELAALKAASGDNKDQA